MQASGSIETSKQPHYNKQYKNSEDHLLSKTGSVHPKMYYGTKFRCKEKESIPRHCCCRQENTELRSVFIMRRNVNKMTFIKCLLMKPHFETTIYYKFLKIPLRYLALIWNYVFSSSLNWLHEFIRRLQ